METCAWCGAEPHNVWLQVDARGPAPSWLDREHLIVCVPCWLPFRRAHRADIRQGVIAELVAAAALEPPSPSFDERLLGPARNLSARMRALRLRAGVSQSEIARRMHVDPSMTSLWEKGKTLVPARRFRQLAEALEVPLDALLVPVEPLTPAPPEDPPPAVAAECRPAGSPPTTRSITAEGADALPWESVPSERLAGLDDALPHGYWLDLGRLEHPRAARLLRERLCQADRGALGDRLLSGPCLAERIHQHCSREPDFLASRPVGEAIFRLVLASDAGGLGMVDLPIALAELGRTISEQQLVRLRPALAPYPLRVVPA